MLPKPHGGTLVTRFVNGQERELLRTEARRLPRLELTPELARDVMNIAAGVFSPLEGFLRREDFELVIDRGRLGSGVPWTIPIVLAVSTDEAKRLGTNVALAFQGEPFALLDVEEVYSYHKEKFARGIFGTVDRQHPGVARIESLGEKLVGGRITVFEELTSAFPRYSLRPVETRVLFEAKGWRTVVGFQTRNVPHLGHEYLQKTALTFSDGLFINPVVGRKKQGDFEDEVILRAYEALVRNYYPSQRVVMAILETEMRYAGPREAIFHAILRKNFGCTHFIVGRDHAGVGTFYPPYAAQEIFEQYPDLGIVPWFFTAFFYCQRCRGVANDKICPHPQADRVNFSGTQLRRAYTGGTDEIGHLVRPEVAAAIREFEQPFVTDTE